MIIDLHEIVHFYDENPDARPHSSAVKLLAHEEFAIQLLIDFLRRSGSEVKIWPHVPTSVGRGPRLDAWITVVTDVEVHYQVEVKAWSFHGYGDGKPLPVMADVEELSQFMISKFAQYWNAETGRFNFEGINKVLGQMKHSHAGEIRPLACLWAAMHPSGDIDEPFFEVIGVRNKEFKKIWFFSISSYLRQCLRNGIKTIELELPKTVMRLHHINKIFRVKSQLLQRGEE